MRNVRSSLILILVAVGLLVAACGEPTSDSEADGAASPMTDQAQTGDGPTGGTIPVGTILAMTGGASYYGDVMEKGATLGADLVNDAGGVEGYTLDVKIEDHQSGDSEIATQVTRRFASQDVPVILSSFTAPTAAIVPLATENNILLLNGGGTGAELVDQPGLYNTRMLAGPQLFPPLVNWAVPEHDAQRVAVVYWNDASGQSVNTAVKEECEELGCEVVVEEPVEIGTSEFGTQLARIRASEVDLIVAGVWGEDVGHFVSQVRRQGVDAPIIGNEWTSDAQQIGGEAMEGYVAIIDTFNPETADNEHADEFMEAWPHEDPPDLYAANYYDMTRLVIPELIRLAVADGQDPSEPGVLRETMETAVADGHEFPTVYGESMSFEDNNTVVKTAYAFRVEDGELSAFGAFDPSGELQLLSN